LGWTGFGLVLVTQFFSALPVRPTVAEALYLVFGHTAFVGIALYGVARLADLVADLRDARTRLADAEVARERSPGNGWRSPNGSASVWGRASTRSYGTARP
jgi:two-component system sensor histidine kinase DesK